MIKVKTHGKLYIAGEYQVLNSGGNAIIFGMSRYIHFKIMEHERFIYISRNKKYYFKFENNTFKFSNDNKIVNEAIKIAFKYLIDNNIKIRTFKIDIKSELETNEGAKYGFGSSSAIITGIIKAILLFQGLKIDNQLIFKLAVVAQINAKSLTSGGDLAAALYGTFIYYERYDLDFVMKNIHNKNIFNIKWPKLVIEQIIVNDIFVMAIWTNKSYKTKPLGKAITKKQYRYANRLVKVLKAGLGKGNFKLINKAIGAYDLWMKNILEDTNRYITSYDEISLIAKKSHLSSKLSGAGGGDSAIVLYRHNEKAALITSFDKAGFETFTF